ncbi:MAG: peptidylprolyl isomerase [Bacteroidales bacterium]|nr:peptidylprolyl isomerase [Bacteroidales bacterium]
MKMIEIATDYGNIVAVLYNETPKHRDNISTLISQNYYDDLLFHRVIDGFMIQTGDPLSRNAKPNQMLGNGGPSYTIPAEFHVNAIHKKGAIAAARLGDQQNPLKASSGSQFYIVQGKVYSEDELQLIENQRISSKTHELVLAYLYKPENKTELDMVIQYEKNGDAQALQEKIAEIHVKLQKEINEIQKFRYTAEQKEVYKTIGGTPFLDFEYTVFGEVVSGLEVVDKIASVETKQDRPVDDVSIKITLKE